MPFAPLGVKLGYWLLHKVPEALVYRIFIPVPVYSGGEK